MYNLDINFLKDRGLEPQVQKTTLTKTKKTKASLNEKIPIIAGGAIAVIFPAATFGYNQIMTSQQAQLIEEAKGIDGQIASVTAQNEQIKTLEAQVTAAKANTQAFANVFNQVKPWSALLQDLSDRLPIGVQIRNVQQAGTNQLTIQGLARSYNDVNDLVLSLKKSSFFVPDTIRLQSARLTAYTPPAEKKTDKSTDKDKTPEYVWEYPQIVDYSISIEISTAPASQLVDELSRKGAVGLVSRLRTLQQKGAVTNGVF
jgi:type IV pilus assembly protein PilN